MSEATPAGETTIEPAAIQPTDPTVNMTPGGAAKPGAPLAAGTVLGQYRIVSHLGRGGMGDVYRALDVALEREVALKTIVKALGADESFVLRFKEEAKAAAKMSHPHLVQVHSFGEHEGTLFFAMELVPGKSLGDRLREGPVPWRDAARFAAQAARGLEAAAAQGVIHRDVKPENLLVGADGSVKVADFGLAKRLQSDAVNTASGVIVGTPRYMSPEQAQGDALDFRSDMYSLGATLFHLVAGRPVFDGNSAMKVCMKHIQEPPPSLSSVAPGVPEALSRTVARMLAKRRDERHATYANLIAELESIAAGSGSAVTVLAPAPVAPAATPTGTSRPLVQVVKRPDGGFEVGLNCPVERGPDETVKKARAAAPLAPRWRRFAADMVDLGYAFGLLALFALMPFPHRPYPQAILALLCGMGSVQFLTRRGGTIGERLLELRLVSKTGGLPSMRAVGFGWLLEKGFAVLVFLCAIAWDDLVASGLLPRQILLSAASFIAYDVVECSLAIGTGRSLRDRVYGTRVVDVRGLPDEDLSG